jgi:hypothetical protein
MSTPMSFSDSLVFTYSLSTPAEAEALALLAARRDRIAQNFLNALFIACQTEKGRVGFAYDLRQCAGLCRATWNEEALWDGLVHVRRGMTQYSHLMYAAKCGDVVRVRWLLSRGAPTELTSWIGSTAIMFASQFGHIEVIRVLLVAGANVHASCTEMPDESPLPDEEGKTSLHWAAYNGHIDIIRVLLLAGADDTGVDASGNTARQALDTFRVQWPTP